MENQFNACLQEAMLIASDSYSVPRADIEFTSFINATQCLTGMPYLPQTIAQSATIN